MRPFAGGPSPQRLRLICRGSGIYVWDSDGVRLLDAMSGVGCVTLGYGRPELIEAATRQMEELAYYGSHFDTSVPSAIELSDLLCEVTPEGFEHFFLTNSGSEATDTVLRLVRRYWDLAGQPGKKVIISVQNSYHGSTVFAAALGKTEAAIRELGLPISDIALIGQPNTALDTDHAPAGLFGLRAALWLEAKILALGPEKVAAFIGEPVQGGGGFVVPPATYWPEIERVCRKYDVLVVSDEVTCGFGRLGTWFGCERFGFRPDLMTFAKGVTSGYFPLGGVAIHDRIAGLLFEQGGGAFEHGFTSSGHPVACAVAIATIRVLQREHIIERVAEQSAPHLNRRFLELQDHPLVGMAETCGMTGSLEIVRNKDTGETFAPGQLAAFVCRERCYDEGVIVRPAGHRINVTPPLVITPEETDDMIERIRRGLDRAERDLRQRHLP